MTLAASSRRSKVSPFPLRPSNLLAEVEVFWVSNCPQLMQSENDSQSAEEGNRTYRERVMDDLGKLFTLLMVHVNFFFCDVILEF